MRNHIIPTAMHRCTRLSVKGARRAATGKQTPPPSERRCSGCGGGGLIMMSSCKQRPLGRGWVVTGIRFCFYQLFFTDFLWNPVDLNAVGCDCHARILPPLLGSLTYKYITNNQYVNPCHP